MENICRKLKVLTRHIAWWYALIFLGIIAVLLILDIATKEWIRGNLPPGGSFPEIWRLNIVNVQNTGSAFGMFTNQAFLLSIVAIAGLVVVLLFFRYLRRPRFSGWPGAEPDFCRGAGQSHRQAEVRLRNGFYLCQALG